MLYVSGLSRKLILIHLLLLFSLHAWASGPAGGAIQGTLFTPGGGPVTSSNVTFKVQVLDKSATCVLYEEVHTGLDLSGTNGDFSFNLGSGSSKVNNVDSSSTLKANIFRNDVNVAASASCPGGVTVAAGDERLIRVMYDVAGGTSYSTLTPDMKALGAPYSVVAETLQGKSPSNFVQIVNDATHVLTQANVENIFSSTNYPKLNSLLNGSASVDLNNQKLINVANPTSAQDAATKNYSDTSFGGKTLDITGIGAASGDKFVMYWDQAAQKWVAGLPNDTTKLPLAGGTMTGPIAMGAQNITNIGHMTMAAQRTLGLGTFTDAQETALIATPLAAADAGKFWYNSDRSELRVWNGSAAVAAGAGGDFKKDGSVAMTGNLRLGNQWLSNDGGSEGIRIDDSGNVGIGTTAPAMPLSLGDGIANDGGLLALGYGTVGTNGTTLTTTGAGQRMIWYPKKAAFRAGGVDTTNGNDVSSSWWNDANIGNYSIGLGLGCRASGTASVCLGQHSTVSGAAAIAAGQGANASSTNSIALGTWTNALSSTSIALGDHAWTFGTSAISISTGSNTKASGTSSIALGRGVATGSAYAGSGGDYSLAIGLGNPAGTIPYVSGNSSLGIFMGDQSGAAVTANNVMAIVGGRVGIGTTTPTTGSTLDINAASAATSSIIIPRDTTANRPASGVNGMMRYNSSIDQFEGYAGGAWVSFASTSGGSSGQSSSGALTYTSNSDTTGSDGGFVFQNGGSNVLTINNAGDVNVASTTISTNSTTGALVVGGGLGVANQINAGGTITGTALMASKSDATAYASPGATDTPTGATLTVANSSNTNSTGSFALLRARNSSSLVQNAYIGAISVTGAANYTPAIVIGQQTGASAFTERVRIDSNGNVGIGTTTVNSALDVRGPSGDFLSLGIMRLNSNSGTNDMGIKMGAVAGAGALGYSFIQSLHTSVANDGNLVLNPSGVGSVGIGTTSPAAALDVNGSIYLKGLSGLSFVSTDTTTGGSIAIGPSALAQQSALASGAYGNIAIGYQSMGGAGMTASAVSNVAIGYQTMTGTMGSNQNVAVGYQAMKNDTSTTNYSVAVGYQAMLNGANSTWMTAVGAGALKNGGNKAYSTAVGTEALGGSGGGGFYSTAVGHRAGYSVTHGMAGNSFFGSSSGTSVTSGQYNTILGYNSAATLTTGSSNIVIGYSADVPTNSTANFLNIGNLIFATGMNGTVAAPAGKVGIGTTAPTEQLDVVGYIRTRSGIVFPDGTIQTTNGSAGVGVTSATDVSFAADTDADTTGSITMATGGTTRFTIANGGNVGIGSTTPVSALDVNGAISIKGVNGISYPSNDSTVNGSIAVGPQALSSLSGTFAVSSTALGYQALKSLTTGYSSTAVGYQALMSVTTNYSGTAVGYMAAKSFTTSSQPYATPTAIGYQALTALTTGGSNTSVGRNSFSTITTGANNTGLGDAAGQYKASTSADNTAVGAFSLYSPGTGSFNTAVGSSALNATTSASSNTAIGYKSGTDVTTGAQNIFVGAFPTSAVGVTTGSNNILIGYDVRPASQTSSNQMNIGNLIYATGIGSGTTAATGGVGIGTNAPITGAILDVNGTGATQSSIVLPRDTTANRPGTGVAGMIRYNTTLGTVEWYNGSAWTNSPAVTSPTFATNVSISGTAAAAYVSTDASNAMPLAANAGLNMNNVATLDGSGSFIKFGANNTAATSQKALIGAISNTSGNTPSLVFGQQTGASTYAERMRIDASGNVGIGTTTPNYKLSLITDNAGDSNGIAVRNTNATGFTEVTLGNSSNAEALLIGVESTGVGGGGNAYFTHLLNKDMLFSTNNTERVRISAGGNVGIGTNNPSFTLDVNGSARATGSVASWSDVRAKKNIVEIPDALNKIQKLRGVTFDWRLDEFPGKKFKEGRDMGVIAQDVEKVFPEAVITAPDGYKSVAYGELVAPLIQALKEFYAQWFNDSAELHREIDQLKLQNAELMKRLEALERNQRAPASAH